MFIKVTSTRKNSEQVDGLIAVDQIATVTSHAGRCIITLKGSSFDVWADQTFDEVNAAIEQANTEGKDL